MAVPDVVPIAHEPGHRTDMIGRYAGGLFLGSITYAFPEGFVHGDGWEDHKRLFAVLHRFDLDGRHVDSDVWCAGTWREQARRPLAADSVLARAEARMEDLLGALPGREYGDIAIRPFRLVVDGVLFGLIVEGDERAELYPDGLGFFAPWDGDYST
ncbi:hypothetical protein ACFY4C_17990 [Actinomadura viridis]|uniref:hypothetical protein n=1 Tax=Actinomadura viridis TaxID=58110 RepID=UPI0036BE6355